jgi:hypothetical protein
MDILQLRSRKRNILKPEEKAKCVLLVISRDRRVNDNWSLIYAEKFARENKLKLIIALFRKYKVESKNTRQQNLISKGNTSFIKKISAIGIQSKLFNGEFSATKINYFCKSDNKKYK